MKHLYPRRMKQNYYCDIIVDLSNTKFVTNPLCNHDIVTVKSFAMYSLYLVINFVLLIHIYVDFRLYNL